VVDGPVLKEIANRFQFVREESRLAVFKDMSTYIGTPSEIRLDVYDWYDMGKPEFLTATFTVLEEPQKHSAVLEAEYIDEMSDLDVQEALEAARKAVEQQEDA
jgi:hypothetical protein